MIKKATHGFCADAGRRPSLLFEHLGAEDLGAGQDHVAAYERSIRRTG